MTRRRAAACEGAVGGAAVAVASGVSGTLRAASSITMPCWAASVFGKFRNRSDNAASPVHEHHQKIYLAAAMPESTAMIAWSCDDTSCQWHGEGEQ